MSSKKNAYPERITREEIEEAMGQFFARGGKIKKIDAPQKAAASLLSDSFDLQEGLGSEDISYLDFQYNGTMY